MLNQKHLVYCLLNVILYVNQSMGKVCLIVVLQISFA